MQTTTQTKMEIISFNASCAMNLLINLLNSKIIKVVKNVKINIFYQTIQVNSYLHAIPTKVLNLEFQFFNNNYLLFRI